MPVRVSEITSFAKVQVRLVKCSNERQSKDVIAEFLCAVDRFHCFATPTARLRRRNSTSKRPNRFEVDVCGSHKLAVLCQHDATDRLSAEGMNHTFPREIAFITGLRFNILPDCANIHV